MGGKRTSDEMAGSFECNICLDMAKNPVVTCCGHLFCWPCLYRWLQLPRSNNACPVCKRKVNMNQKGSVIPIYGSGSSVKIPKWGSNASRQDTDQQVLEDSSVIIALPRQDTDPSANIMNNIASQSLIIAAAQAENAAREAVREAENAENAAREAVREAEIAENAAREAENAARQAQIFARQARNMIIQSQAAEYLFEMNRRS